MDKIGIDIAYACELLNNSELVAIPTETVYGLAGNALDRTALARIFAVKNRPEFDPLIFHIPDQSKIDAIAISIPKKARILADRFWPGPLTIILPKKPHIPDLATAGLGSVAIRIPNHPLTLELLQQLKFPLAAPSANPFGYVSPTSPQHVNDQLGEAIPYILDGGNCTVGIESTIISFMEDEPLVLRFGGISQEKIQSIIGEVKVSNNPDLTQAPGTMKSHYAPDKKVLLGDPEELLSGHRKKNVGILSFQRVFPNLPGNQQIVLSPEGSLEEAARNLFSALRLLDKMDIEIILAEVFPDHGLGKAINDRLRRAAAKK